jgi:uncharacterized membrane protein
VIGDPRTRAQRWSDAIAEFCGSWGFVAWFSVGITVWCIANVVLVEMSFDPYPFILLNLALTVISTMQGPIIMMAQNRQVDRDREMVIDLHNKLDALGRQIDQIARSK